MSAPFGPKPIATAEAGDLLMITRGTGAALEVEKLDPVAAATAALIAAGIDALLGGDAWRSGGGSGTGSSASTVLHGSGAPASELGNTDDFYIRTSDWTIWGPKAAGSWGEPVPLIGPAGSNGTNGSNGSNGAAFFSGAGTPASGTGTDGDWYFDTAARSLHGPKTAGAWGSGTSLVGAAGAAGATVNLRKTATHIEYQHVGDADWTQLVVLSDITGPGGAAGSNGTNGTNGADGATLAGINPQSATSYTLALGDASKLVECSNAAAITVTVPPQSSVAFPISTVVHVAQAGAGQVTIAPGAGVTIKLHADFSPKTLGPEAVVSLAKVATDTWRLFGLLEVA
ncbi:MAG: hypothetical protein U1E59_02130 [Amaricoccus sp.]